MGEAEKSKRSSLRSDRTHLRCSALKRDTWSLKILLTK